MCLRNTLHFEKEEGSQKLRLLHFLAIIFYQEPYQSRILIMSFTYNTAQQKNQGDKLNRISEICHANKNLRTN